VEQEPGPVRVEERVVEEVLAEVEVVGVLVVAGKDGVKAEGNAIEIASENGV